MPATTTRSFNLYTAKGAFTGRAFSRDEALAKLPAGGHIRNAVTGRKVDHTEVSWSEM